MVTATPTIHLNGTGRDSLKREYREALNKLQDAKKAVENVTVHMRDYYVQDNGNVEFELARNEHRARINALDELITDYTTLYFAADSKP